MRIGGILGAIVLAASSGIAASAEDAAHPPASPKAPTVTIINKSPDAAKTPDVPELAVTPHKPGAAATPAAPAAPPRAQAPAAPSKPGEPATPPRAGEAKVVTPPVRQDGGTSASTDAPEHEAEEASTPAAAPPPVLEPTLAIDINLSTQRMTVSEHGETLYTWPISSARYGYRTPTGTFRPTWMSKMWYSRQYEYAPMPNAIFFHQGVAIHATYALGMLGRPASHGCVRLAPKNAALLYKMVGSHTKERTQIVVHGSPVQTAPRVADYEGGMMLGRSARYRYLPPSFAQRGYYQPAPTYYYSKRGGRYYALPRRQARGLYTYGYGF